MRNVTDLETSKKLVKWMGGVETDIFWRNLHGGKEFTLVLNLSDDKFFSFSRKQTYTNIDGHWRGAFETVPAYTTDDLIERLPKVIHEKEDRPTEKLYIDFNRGLAGYSATGDILGFTHSRKIAHFESTVELRSALAQLVLFCGESGYLEEGNDEL